MELAVFARKHGIKSIILFGSRARGTNSPRSDIDIAVSGGDVDSFTVDVKENTHTLLMFDIVCLDGGVSDSLKAEIERDGVIVYEKSDCASSARSLCGITLDDFSNSLNVLKNADFDSAFEDDIYRTGAAAQFMLTFELAWKALQEVMRIHGVAQAQTGSPREILQLAYKIGFLDDQDIWLLMLRKRNNAAHIYDEDEIDELIVLIRDSFTGAFERLESVLREKNRAAVKMI